jgi:hypothetical protein
MVGWGLDCDLLYIIYIQACSQTGAELSQPMIVSSGHNRFFFVLMLPDVSSDCLL